MNEAKIDDSDAFCYIRHNSIIGLVSDPLMLLSISEECNPLYIEPPYIPEPATLLISSADQKHINVSLYLDENEINTDDLLEASSVEK